MHGSPPDDEVGGSSRQPFLVTKLQKPLLPPSVIARSHLVNRLHQALKHQRSCILIAPTGFGKTTLVNQALEQWTFPSVWVQLDASDNHPTGFWTYIVTALRSLHPDFLSDHPRSDQIYLSNHWIPLLTEGLSKISTPYALVLNDFHHMTDPLINQQLTLLFHYPPPNLRLILISRAEPTFHRTRGRITHQIETLTRNDLRFTPDETLDFLIQTMDLNLSQSTAQILHQRTEGWPAALQIAALCLRDRSQSDRFIEQFGGSNPDLMRYLDEEVFDVLPQHLREFLLRTSVVEILTPEICNRLTGRTDSLQVIQQLIRAQLFIVPLNDGKTQFRYHALFSDYLRSRLEQDTPELVAELKRQAAAYYREHGLIEQAVEYLFAAHDIDAVEQLIHQHAHSRLIGGDADTLLQWINRLPDNRVEASARLLLYKSWIFVVKGLIDRVEAMLLTAEQVLGRDPDQLRQISARSIPGEIAALRAEIAHLSGNFRASTQYAYEALNKLPPENVLTRGLVLMNLGYTAWLSGDPVTAKDFYSQALLPSINDEHEFVQLLARCNLANLELTWGHIHAGHEMYQEVLATTSNRSPLLRAVSSIAHVGMGTVYYVWNRLDLAAKHVRQGLDIAQPWIYISSLLPAYLHLAQIEQARKRSQAVQQAIKAYETHFEISHLVLMRQVVSSYRARLALMRGKVSVAMNWARQSQLNVTDETHFAGMSLYLLLAETLIAGGRAKETLPLLDRMMQTAADRSLNWMLLEIKLVQAAARWKVGDHDIALQMIKQVVEAAAPGGYIRLFVDRGDVVEHMLRQLDEAYDPQSYVSEIMRAFEDSSQHVSQIPYEINRREPQSHEDLTVREVEVINLIAQGMSNEQIANSLFISVGTVKTHIRKIFHKWGCRGRTHAVQLARAKGIIRD